MPTLIKQPTLIQGSDNGEKTIEEYIGLINSSSEELSIARMVCPPGWEEPGQRPEFDEYTVVLKGTLRVTTPTEIIDVNAGQALISGHGEWIRYSTPATEGAEYIAVCLPAFSPETVNRDRE